MLLQSIKYTRLSGKPKEWAIEGCDGKSVQFGELNLIVGKNSTGKTFTLAVIREIASLFSGHLRLSNIRHIGARYYLTFSKGNDIYEYMLEYDNRKIVNESLSVNGENRFDREKKLLFSDESRDWEKVEIADDDLFISLYNNKSFTYLKDFFLWGLTLKNTAFSNQFEKNYLIDDLSKLDVESPADLKDPAILLYTFRKGREIFGEKFVKRIMDHMQIMGYVIHSIDILKIPQGYSLCVKEEGIGNDEDGNGVTDQLEMSQGMFRALSFIIHLNFALMNNISVCILIDDLGEGLDYDRSAIIIDLLLKSLSKQGIQTFVTTNDRYVMNKFPLEYWSVIERQHKKSVFYNYYNSKSVFDDFKYTGLNNFDFLATDFYIHGFDEIHEEDKA